MPQDIYQTAKVAKILLLLEKGKGKQFKGKNLSDIELDQVVYYSSENSDADSDNDNVSEKFLKKQAKYSQFTEIKERDLHKELGECSSIDEVKISLEQGLQNNENNVQLEETLLKKENYELPKKHGIKKISGRMRWSDQEKKIVLHYFKQHLKNKITPKKHECDQLLAQHGHQLFNKDWVKIKTLVYNTFRLKD